MTIMIVGSKGQVGSELVREVIGRGIPFRAFGKEDLDITNRGKVFDLVLQNSPRFIVNAAAYTKVDLAEQNYPKALSVNRDAVKYLSEAAQKLSIPFIHISTDYVFDGMKKEAYLENDQKSPINKYGFSKLEGEKAVADNSSKHLILRTSWVFGLHGNNFVKTMLNLASQKNILKIVDDQRGCPTYARDIASCIVDIIESINCSGWCKWGVYHYAGDSGVSWYEFAREIFERAARIGLIKTLPKINPVGSEEFSSPAPRPLNSQLNCEKIMSEFGVPLSDWKCGVDELIEKRMAKGVV